MDTTPRANVAAVPTRAAPTSGLPVTASRWGTAAAGVVAILLLAGYVHTLQASVLRGQSLRQAQRLADADRVAAAYPRRPALTAGTGAPAGGGRAMTPFRRRVQDDSYSASSRRHPQTGGPSDGVAWAAAANCSCD